MAGQHRARNFVRIGMAAAAAIAVAVTGLVVSSGSAGAAVPLNTSCSARAAAINAPKPPVSVAWANPQVSPCVFDAVSLLDANATIIPGIPGITGATVSVHAVKSTTSYSSVAGFASTEGQTDVARLNVVAPGLFLQATGIHSQSGVSINPFCGGAASGQSWLASLTINGNVIRVSNTPLTINVGLRITVNVNQTIGSGHSVTQRALYITFPDSRYSLVVGESHADLSCVTNT